MKQIILLFFLLAGVIYGAYWLSEPGNPERLGSLKLSPDAPKTSTDKFIKIGQNKIKLEIAKTETERQVGLSNHESLNQDEGMLFVFESQNEKPSFWMKGMKFAIDIVWINDGKITQINDSVPFVQAGTQDSQIPLYSPSKPIDYVLEIPAGYSKAKNIKAGDTIELPQL